MPPSSSAALRIKNNAPAPELCERIARETGHPYLFSSLLCQRGITTREEADAFLNPRLADLPSPLLLKDMDKAVRIVVRAMAEGWPICIHGDYDVDGITATALLANFFRKLSIRTTCYQPDRLSEGYGLQPGFIVENAPPEGFRSLLITVDCGISALDEVKLAREKGFTVIVTDHHEAPPVLPEADAVINPKQKGCFFPFKELSGVGVAFFLAVGVRKGLVEEGVLSPDNAPNLKQFTDLVALGTVADVMPVTGINRILIRAGLETMSSMTNPWISALKSIVRMENRQITTDDISYRFAPRLNAAGRLGKPELSFELLTCEDPIRILELASIIDTINTERREIESNAVDSVFQACEKQVQEGAAGLVIMGEYHPGVIGILASRVVERFNKPTIIFTEDGTERAQLKGSGRTVEAVNLFELLQFCKNTIIQFGGHPMAAGLTVSKENLPKFIERFNLAISQQKKPQITLNEVEIDSAVRTADIFDDTFLGLYHQLEPFGSNNPEPVFLLADAEVIKVDCIKNHLTFAIRVNGITYRGIGFRQAHKIDLLRNGQAQLTVKIKKNVFRGVERTEVHAENII